MKQPQQIKLLLGELESKKILASLSRVDLYNDEPKFFLYSSKLANIEKYTDGYISKDPIHASGFSFTSRENALLKCLMETLERFRLYCYRKKTTEFLNYNQIHKEVIDLSSYSNTNFLKQGNYGWVKGVNLSTESACYIPAQLVFLNYKGKQKEKYISPVNSTGAASGFDHVNTLLQGLYEIIERDAFMTIYLNKIKVARLDIGSLNSSLIQSVHEKLKRYNLELYVFDIRNDLQIPSFLSVITDKTGWGPALTTGLKSSLNVQEAILGSIGEACVGRIYMRNRLVKNRNRTFVVNESKINSLFQRGLFWALTQNIHKLNFLITSKSKKYQINKSEHSLNVQFNYVKKILDDRGFKIYYTEITPFIIPYVKYFIYKVLVPALHPLFLSEKQKFFNEKRLKNVANFFGKKRYFINKIPHPFL